MDRVYAYVYRRLESGPEAEDVTAETFLAALSKIDDFVWRDGGFGAWIFRIARNLCWDVLRRRGRQASRASESGAMTVAAASPGDNPEEALLEKERLSRLRALVRALPPAERDVVLLKYAAELGNQDIAVVTGRSLTAVSSLLFRARRKLREGLVEDHG